MNVKIFTADGKEVDIKDLDKDFMSAMLKKNPFGAILAATLGLAADALKEGVEDKAVDKEDLFKEEAVVSDLPLEEAAKDECTGDPATCVACATEEYLNDFGNALEALKDGYEVTKRSWMEAGYHYKLGLNEGNFNLSGESFQIPYSLAPADILAEDWLIISK